MSPSLNYQTTFVVYLIIVMRTAFASGTTTIPGLREEYSMARTRLESIRKTTVHYSYSWIIRRSNIPSDLREYVKDYERYDIEVYMKQNNMRIDYTDNTQPSESKRSVVVISGSNSFQVVKKGDNEKYVLSALGKGEPIYASMMALSSGFFEGAYKLPQQLDVKDIVFGHDFEVLISGAPTHKHSDQTANHDEIIVEFHRKESAIPTEKSKTLYVQAGRIVLLPDRDYSLSSYILNMSSGLSIEGKTEYDQIYGDLFSKSPKAIHVIMSENGKTERTDYSIDRMSISSEPLEDRLFALSEFGISFKKSVSHAHAYFLVASGVLAISIAIFMRVQSTKASRGSTKTMDDGESTPPSCTS